MTKQLCHGPADPEWSFSRDTTKQDGERAWRWDCPACPSEATWQRAQTNDSEYTEADAQRWLEVLAREHYFRYHGNDPKVTAELARLEALERAEQPA